MPITPAAPFPKAAGQTIRSSDWNQAVTEVIRLDTAKVDRAGDRITGSLTIDGALGVGATSPATGAQIAGGSLTVGPISAGPAAGRIEVSGGSGELSFIRRNLAAWPAAPAAGDRYVWYSPDGTARLFTDGRGDILTVGAAGNVVLTGTLTIPKTEGNATFSNGTFSNENTFQPNNLKLAMAAAGLVIVGAPPLTYEFAIGHTFRSFIVGGGLSTSFVKRFSINQNGDLVCSGSKTGYVVDFFVNAVGDTLEQGDVVVIAATSHMRYYGARGDIPVPEVDLTDRAYDTRVCGVVAHFVTEADLPMVDPDASEPARVEGEVSEHPFGSLAAGGEDHRRVADQQLGKMATLGAYAHCKVDADIVPVEAGDLLTTSPTRGHAQKVVDRSQALGAIIGKALAPLRRGKGRIPVFVMLQ
jgi:hypothetical protein